MKKDELERLLKELDLDPGYSEIQEGDILLSHFTDAGYSYNQAKRMTDEGVRSGKLIKLYALIDGKKTNVYRKIE